MDAADGALAALDAEGFTHVTGVACSLLAPLISRLLQAEPPRYLSAVREDAAIGLAAGLYLGGGWPCVLMQNSGIGYCLNALTSLNLIYEIPALLMIGYRGYLGKDAPEHLVMGKSCEALLREIGAIQEEKLNQSSLAFLTSARNLGREHRVPGDVGQQHQPAGLLWNYCDWCTADHLGHDQGQHGSEGVVNLQPERHLRNKRFGWAAMTETRGLRGSPRESSHG